MAVTKGKLFLEKKTHKILWDQEIITDYLIPTKRLSQAIIDKNKKRELSQ